MAGNSNQQQNNKLKWHQPIRVLIVEDEPLIAMDIETVLTHYGYSICGRVMSGEDAIETCKTEKPDAVLMDIMLKGQMNGIEAAEIINRDCSTPVVFLNSHSDQGLMEKALKSLPFGYLLKPFNDEQLKTQIEIAVNRFRAEKVIEKSETMFRRLVDNMNEGLITHTVGYTDTGNVEVTGVALMNPKAREIFKVSSGKIPAVDSLYGKHLTYITGCINKVFSEQKSIIPNEPLEINQHFYKLSCSYMTDDCVSIIFDDETEIIRKEQKYHILVNKAYMPTAICSESEFLYYNTAFKRYTGFDDDHISCLSPASFFGRRLNSVPENEPNFEMRFLSGEKETLEANVIVSSFNTLQGMNYFIGLKDVTLENELKKKLTDFKENNHLISGVLPICASCKKIRDNESNEWIQPEKYLNERMPEVQFTHGICSECMKKLYPDITAEPGKK